MPNEIIEAKTVVDFNEEQKNLIKRTVAKDADDLEFAFFLEVCRMRGLNPLARQIYFSKRKDKRTGKEAVVIQVGIDGFRLQAQRSGEYEGQTAMEWCDHNGRWTSVWTRTDSPPVAARVGVFRKHFREPLYATAHFAEFCQSYRDDRNQLHYMGLWGKMPANQIGKCSEAQALRKAFPEELAGLYTPEELESDTDIRNDGEPPPPPQPQKKERAPRPRNADEVNLRKAFGEMKEKIGTEMYYAILTNFGYKKSTDIPNREAAIPVYHEMSHVLRAQQEAALAAMAEKQQVATEQAAQQAEQQTSQEQPQQPEAAPAAQPEVLTDESPVEENDVQF